MLTPWQPAHMSLRCPVGCRPARWQSNHVARPPSAKTERLPPPRPLTKVQKLPPPKPLSILPRPEKQVHFKSSTWNAKNNGISESNHTLSSTYSIRQPSPAFDGMLDYGFSKSNGVHIPSSSGSSTSLAAQKPKVASIPSTHYRDEPRNKTDLSLSTKPPFSTSSQFMDSPKPYRVTQPHSRSTRSQSDNLRRDKLRPPVPSSRRRERSHHRAHSPPLSPKSHSHARSHTHSSHSHSHSSHSSKDPRLKRKANHKKEKKVKQKKISAFAKLFEK